MVGEAFAAVGGFKALIDIAKSIKDMNDATIRNRTSVELLEKILAAQEAQSALLHQVRELEEKIRGFETWEAEKKRYELKQLGEPGTTAYMLKPDARGTEPPHWICTNCYGNRRVSIFQATTRVEYRRLVHMCPACKSEIRPTVAPEWTD